MGIWRAAVVLQTLLLLPRAQKLAIQFPQPGQIFDHGASIGIQGYVEDLPGQPIAIEILLDGETVYMSETSYTIDIYEPNGFHPGKHNVSVSIAAAGVRRRMQWDKRSGQLVSYGASDSRATGQRRRHGARS